MAALPSHSLGCRAEKVPQVSIATSQLRTPRCLLRSGTWTGWPEARGADTRALGLGTSGFIGELQGSPGLEGG